MGEHRRSLEREFETQMHAFDKEMEKLKTKHRTELEQKVRIKKPVFKLALSLKGINIS